MLDTRPTFTQGLSKSLNRAQRRGWGEVIGLGTRRAREWVVSSDSLVMFMRASGGPFQATEEFHFRETHRADGAAYALWIGTDSPSTFTSRLSDTTRCFVMTSEEKFVHASWVTTESAWTREIKRYLTPPPGDAYVFESYTRDEVRGRGVYPMALQNISARLSEEGINRLWVAVEEHNPPSLKAVTKGGFERAFEIPFARRFGVVRIGEPSGPLAAAALPFLSVTPHRSSL